MTFQRDLNQEAEEEEEEEEESGISSKYNQLSAASKVEDGNENSLGEWLSLGSSRNESIPVGDCSDPELQSQPQKVFSCNFCMRKFYSSQALGGHQNAHKRERGTSRGHQQYCNIYKNSTKMVMCVADRRSLGIQPHSLVHKPNRSQGSSAVAARLSDTYNAGFELVSWTTPFKLVEHGLDNSCSWPGSFRMDKLQNDEPSSETQRCTSWFCRELFRDISFSHGSEKEKKRGLPCRIRAARTRLQDCRKLAFESFLYV